MPLFVFGALWQLRPLRKGRVLAFVLPILILSGGWHAHQLFSFGQIVWSNHGGYNIQRAWPMVPMPPLLPEERASRPETELVGSFNTDVHGENSKRVLRAVVAHIMAHPLDSAVHAVERVAFVISGEINLQGRIPDSAVIPVYAVLVKYPALWLMLGSLVIVVAMLLRPRAIPWLAGDLDNMLILSTAATLLIFALTEAGEEARFLIAVLPMLALWPVPRLSPDPDPVRYSPRARRLAWATAVIAVIGIELFAQGALRRQAAAARGGELVPPVAAVPSATLRIGLVHVRGGLWRDRDAAARRIAACFEGLDFIGLNGVRGRSLLDSAPDQATILAALTGRAGLFAPTERRWGTDSYGNGFLSALPAARWEREPLPAPRTMPRRNLVVAELVAGGTRLNALVTQLDARLDHDVQMKVVVDRFLALPKPAVLLGELNARRDEPAMARLLQLPDVESFTVDLPTPIGPRPVDWIVTRGLVIGERRTCDTGVSDHPLLAVTVKP
jgi:endonuclease/exonuclease/phosphatase family metal-dependent hydrolase